MPKISVSIDVSDMETAVQFYSKALECNIVREGDEISELSADNSGIYLLKREPGTNPVPNNNAIRNYERHWTPVHLDIVVPDINKALPLVTQYGGTKEGSESGDWGSIAYCADPFGNGFCLIQYNA